MQNRQTHLSNYLGETMSTFEELEHRIEKAKEAGVKLLKMHIVFLTKLRNEHAKQLRISKRKTARIVALKRRIKELSNRNIEVDGGGFE